MAIGFARYQKDFCQDLKQRRARKRRWEHGEAPAGVAQRIGNIAASGGGITSIDVERYLGRNDLVRINYLERGLLAARAVCRIRVTDPFGGGGEWGTGFLVGPRLLLTNNHVIESVQVAQRCEAEFGYESDINGHLSSGQRFALDPASCFITSKELDFTLVAVAVNGAGDLSKFGFLRLYPELHKIEESEFVTIIQHPNGEEKYIAVRENELIKKGDSADPALDNFLWYSSDTAPGSSGAPDFNDSWQVVALHHRGVPETRERNGVVEYELVDGTWVSAEAAEHLPEYQVKWIANEGVRVSRIVAEIEKQHREGAHRYALVQEFLDDANGVKPYPGTPSQQSVVAPEMKSDAPAADGGLLILEKAKRNIHPLDYYDGRTGYDNGFLGVSVPLPQLTAAAKAFGQPAQVQGSSGNVLRYTHFSLALNATRGFAFFTAVNIDGKRWMNLTRDTDKWFFDPRVDLDLQIDDRLYGDEPSSFGKKGWFDRGHLVRRLDPVWGTATTAALANDDTFHWTNCSPQYWGFNQGQQLWQGLENYILYNTDDEDVRANVFSGPIFQQDDEEHRGVQIPQYYWKVVVVRDQTGKIFSSAYVVSQKKYATNIPFEELPIGDFNNFQTGIIKLEQRTGLDFGKAVRDADVLSAAGVGHESADIGLRGLSDIIHPRRGDSGYRRAVGGRS